MDIGSLLNQAGGVKAIARQLGVDEATVERGAATLAPHVLNGVEQQGLPEAGGDAEATDPQALRSEAGEPAQAGAFGGPGGMGGVLGGLLGAGGSGGGLLGAGGSGGGILGALVGGGAGNQILGHIFGSKDKSRDVAAQASQESGVDPSVLKKLLPILAGAVAVYVMTHRGRGDAPAGAAEPAGGGGLLGSIVGQFGGSRT